MNIRKTLKRLIDDTQYVAALEKQICERTFSALLFLNSYSSVDIHLAFTLTGHLREFALA